MGYSPRGRKESDTTERLHWLAMVLALIQKKKKKKRKKKWVGSLGQEDPLEKGITTHSSILTRGAWRATVHGTTKSGT